MPGQDFDAGKMQRQHHAPVVEHDRPIGDAGEMHDAEEHGDLEPANAREQEPNGELEHVPEAALMAVLVHLLDAAELRERLSSKRRFVWLKREITPEQRGAIHRLGLPGIGFMTENKRVYPNGVAAAAIRISSS